MRSVSSIAHISNEDGHIEWQARGKKKDEEITRIIVVSTVASDHSLPPEDMGELVQFGYGRSETENTVATNESTAESEAPWASPYSEAAFERMDPAKLLRLVRSGTLKPGDLTFATEIAGRRLSGTEVVPILVKLLTSDSPLVREGAVCGLSHHLTGEVRQELQNALSNEQSRGVAEAIRDTLEDE